MFRCHFALAALLAFGLEVSAGAAEPAPGATPGNDSAATAAARPTILITEGLMLGPVGRSFGRFPLHVDPVEKAIVEGTWRAPAEGDKVIAADGTEQSWKRATAADNEYFEFDRWTSYFFATFEAEEDGVWLLSAAPCTMVYVNGEPRPMDSYGDKPVYAPVKMTKGKNELLFQGMRGGLRAELSLPRAEVFVSPMAAMLPDAIEGESFMPLLGILATNAAESPQNDQFIIAEADTKNDTLARLSMAPLTYRHVRMRIKGEPFQKGEVREFDFRVGKPTGVGVSDDLRSRYDPLADSGCTISIRGVDKYALQRRTFESEIDGSVQYYALRPASPASWPNQDFKPAITLALHGASVDAFGHAAAYAQKPWTHIVSPTNRGPWGYDWEDWGRLDALEVLAEAQATLDHDPQRIYLTGHSMGGHGTYSLGVLYPEKWAAIGPSAGWISFWSYSSSQKMESDSPAIQAMERASAASDTMALVKNLAPLGVYILHGDADDNVPVDQTRTMVEELKKFHEDFRFHEQPGAGHWWGGSDVKSADCVDWAPMFDMFARRRIPLPVEVRHIDFFTVNPGISAKCHWATIEAQIEPMKMSRVVLDIDPQMRIITGTTENVESLFLDLDVFGDGPFTVTINGHTRENVHTKRPYMERGVYWPNVDELMEPHSSFKGPHRSGPFKDAFRHKFLFVYGTHGTAEENRFTYAKARYDAESFDYRGNGGIDMVPDTEFEPAKFPDRSVIIYGNASINTAWQSLLADSPIRVLRGEVKVNGEVRATERAAVLMVRPRPDSVVASVGVVAGTDVPGMRLTERIGYQTSGVQLPDYTIMNTDVLEKSEGGVIDAGFFDNEWELK